MRIPNKETQEIINEVHSRYNDEVDQLYSKVKKSSFTGTEEELESRIKLFVLCVEPFFDDLVFKEKAGELHAKAKRNIKRMEEGKVKKSRTVAPYGFDWVDESKTKLQWINDQYKEFVHLILDYYYLKYRGATLRYLRRYHTVLLSKLSIPNDDGSRGSYHCARCECEHYTDGDHRFDDWDQYDLDLIVKVLTYG